MEEIKNTEELEKAEKTTENKVEENVEKPSKQPEKKEEPKSNTNTSTTNKKAEEPKSKAEKEPVTTVNENKITYHKFDVDEKVWVADFLRTRESDGFTRIENQYKFVPVEAEIERIVITKESGNKVVRYKIKSKAGSAFDEDSVFYTKAEAEELCKKRNK